jgi:hypothetical protein
MCLITREEKARESRSWRGGGLGLGLGLGLMLGLGLSFGPQTTTGTAHQRTHNTRQDETSPSRRTISDKSNIHNRKTAN